MLEKQKTKIAGEKKEAPGLSSQQSTTSDSLGGSIMLSSGMHDSKKAEL